MNWKNRLTNYNFWISLISAVLLILQAFKFEFDVMYINEIATAVLGLLVVIGIISDPTKTAVKQIEAKTKKVKKEEISNTPTVNENVEESKQETIIETVMENIGTEQVIKTENTETNSVDMVEENIINQEIIKKEETVIPIDAQDEIANNNNEIDFKNLVEKISNDISSETEKFKEFAEIIEKFLKNNEKTEENLENLINFSNNIEITEEKNEIEKQENTAEENKTETEHFEQPIEISSFNIVN